MTIQWLLAARQGWYDLDPLEWLTLALVVVTAFYGFQTWRTVAEMKRSREMQVRPKLTPELQSVGAGVGLVRITNVGQGPALDADLSIVLRGRKGVENHVRPWKASLLTAGERHTFQPPRRDDGELMKLDEITAKYERVALTGRLRDSLGNLHMVDEQSDDLEAIWIALKASKEILDQDYLRRMAQSLETIAGKS